MTEKIEAIRIENGYSSNTSATANSSTFSRLGEKCEAYRNRNKGFDVLSFDGGGTKGVMEAVIAKDIMNMATLLIRSPEKIKDLCIKILEENPKEHDQPNDLRKIANLLKGVESPVHPIEVFDMIVGTSTGSLISFGLVGGNRCKNKEDPTRYPDPTMTIDQVIDFFDEASPYIFEQSNCFKKCFNCLFGCLPIPCFPFTQKGLGKIIDGVFGEDATLKDFGKVECVAAAVALQFDKKEGDYRLKIFDTRGSVSYPVKEVLKASSCAPVYFDTPTQIMGVSYVDGGVGGNCPLFQAIPRMQEIQRNSIPNSCLSIAPPHKKKKDIPSFCQCCFWLGEFSQKVTDGDAVYQEMKRFSKNFANATNIEPTTFQRLAPRSEVSKKFKLDSMKIQTMANAVKEEAEDDRRYFQDVLAAAIVIAARKIETEEKLDAFASICEKMVKWALTVGQNAGNKIPEIGFNTAKAFHKAAADIAKNKVNHLVSLRCLGESLFELEQFSKAREKFEEFNSIFNNHYSETVDDKVIRLKARVLRYLGKCHYELGDYDESEETLIEAKETAKKLPELEEGADILKAQIDINMSLTLLELNEFNKALEMANEAFAAGLSGEWLTKARLVRGRCFMDLENYSSAIDDFNIDSITVKGTWMKEDKMMRAILNSDFGYCYLSSGKLKKAEEYTLKGFEDYEEISRSHENPRIIEIHFMRGQTMTRTGNFKEALTTLEKGLQIANDMFRSTPDHPLIAQCKLYLGLLLIEPSSCQDLIQAGIYLKEALAMQSNVYSECERQQLWKQEGITIKNRLHDTMNQNWIIKSHLTDFIIEIPSNILLGSRNEVLSFNPDKKEVIQEPFDKDKGRQVWIKGKEDRKGYFNLTHLESGVRKLLTATSTKGLQIRDQGKHMTMVKTYCGLARLALAKGNLHDAMDHIETGLDMVKDLLPNRITHAELLAVKGDIELDNHTDQDRLANAEKTFKEALKMLEDNANTISSPESRSNLEEWKCHPIVLNIYANMAFIFASRKDSANAVKYIKDVETMFQIIYEQDKLNELTSPSYGLFKDLYARIMLSIVVNHENFSDMKNKLSDLMNAIGPENDESIEQKCLTHCKVWMSEMKLRSPLPVELEMDIDTFLTKEVVEPLKLSFKIMDKVGVKTHDFDRMSMGIGLRRASRTARA